MAETLAEHAGHMRRYLQQHPLPCVRDERRKHFSGVRYLHIIICLQIRIQGAVTRPEDCEATLRAFKAAFEVRGLGAAWERVIAIVVQPGVEFADESVVEYERGAARELCGFPDCFEVVVGSLHNGIPEDKTAVLREALRLMGLGPGEAVMIGDRAGAELDALEARLTADEPDKAAVIAAHRDILRDPAMDEEIRKLVCAERLSPERETAFRAQLRATLRASAFGRLKLMLPMVGGLDELRDTKRILEEEKAKLTAEGADWDRDIKLGIMVEVPSVALIAEHAAREADFASVGTNDLTQYLCAADRGNPLVRRYYQEYHPALFRLLGELARAFGAAGKELGICGELGGDALAIPALIGLGIRRLSMGPAALARAKRVVCGLELAEAEKLAARVCALATNEEVKAALESFAAEGKVV